MNNNFVKYVFSAIVFVIVVIIIVLIAKNNSKDIQNMGSLDQTSTVSNIKTDLRFAITELDTINPIVSKNRNVQEISKLIFDSLVSLDENYKLEYKLAESIKRIDEYTYDVKLKENAMWHNEELFTADDVRYTIETIQRDDIDSIYKSNIRNISGVDIVNVHEVIIHINNPEAFFEYNLTFPIISSKQYENIDIFDASVIPHGTGIYRIESISENLLKLMYFDKYWSSEKRPLATAINVNLYGSITETYKSFKNGELDILSVRNNNYEEYIGTIGYNKLKYNSREYDFMTINVSSDGVLSDVNVRKAISLFIDKNSMVAACLGDEFVASNFSLDMGNWLYTKDLNIAPNPAEAETILQNDDWQKDGKHWYKKVDGRTIRLEFTIIVSNSNENRVRVADNIKSQLENYGIVVNIQYYSENRLADSINNGEYDAAIVGIRTGFSPNVETFFREGNMAYYNNQEVNDLMRDISENTFDDKKLLADYNRLYDIYLQEVPYIGLYRNVETTIYNQNLVGSSKGNGYNLYNDIDIWYRQ